ncbi:putative thioredoxin-like 3-3 [Iris pallida]|uniref:Thioredoxin-like 3-3 n=1 Tax=Iris pallida TaxID=29817 RepID=A0AAX6HJP0_IRIPA|nr:putative thioredoxin-like 3-3 [Iris pallida]
MALHGPFLKAQSFLLSASSATNLRTFPLCMRTSMSAPILLRTFFTLQPSTSTGTERGLTRCSVQEKRGSMIACGYIHNM